MMSSRSSVAVIVRRSGQAVNRRHFTPGIGAGDLLDGPR